MNFWMVAAESVPRERSKLRAEKLQNKIDPEVRREIEDEEFFDDGS